MQTTFENETRRSNDDVKERKTLFIIENCLKMQLQHSADDSKELEVFLYNLDGTIVKERRAPNTVISLHSQLSSLRTVVEGLSSSPF